MRIPEQLSCTYTQSPVTFLTVTRGNSERLALKALTAETRWKSHDARSIGEALRIVATHDIGAIISDCDLPDGTWIDLLDGVRSRCNPPRLIVFSPVADDRFWAEVLSIGGYDVLATPFDRVEVLRATHVAWLSWNRTARVTAPMGIPAEVCEPKRTWWF